MRDENGEIFTKSSLLEKVSIISFFDKNAAEESKENYFRILRSIQKRVRGVGTKILLWSVGDFVKNGRTKEVLFNLARKERANPFIWKFLADDTKKNRNLPFLACSEALKKYFV